MLLVHIDEEKFEAAIFTVNMAINKTKQIQNKTNNLLKKIETHLITSLINYIFQHVDKNQIPLAF